MSMINREAGIVQLTMMSVIKREASLYSSQL